MKDRAPSLPRDLRRQVNRLAAQRARREVDAAWRRHQAALQAAVLDLLVAGQPADAVLRELQAETVR